MDWIKVLTKHILYEYNDLKDSEFAAWIKIMALTAHLEHEPTRKQILSHVNYQTIDSLERKLHDHSIDLSYIIHKVLIDVSYVAHRRESLKRSTQRYREHNKPVSDNVMLTSCIREDKIREDKITHKAKPSIEVPEWIKKETWESFIEMRKLMRAKPTTKAIELLFLKLKKFKDDGQDPNKIIEQSIENNWKGVFPLKDGGNGNGGSRPGDFQGKRTFDANARRDTSGGAGTPARKYIPEPAPELTDAERAAQAEKLREFISHGLKSI